MFYAINDVMIEDVNCYWDELRLRDCNYTISHCGQNCTIAGVRCKIIKNVNFATVNNSVLIIWEYRLSNKTSHIQPNSFDVRCNGQQYYINSVSNGTSSVSVGHLLSNTFESYDCCVSAKSTQPTNATTDIRCASIRSEDLLPPTTISDTNMTATVVVGAVLGCVIVILLVLLAVCGGALFHLVRSRTSASEVPKR